MDALICCKEDEEPRESANKQKPQYKELWKC